MNYAMVFTLDERISTSRSQGMIGSGRNLFCPWIPFGLKLKNTHLTFGFILSGQVSGLKFLFSLSINLTSICLNDVLHSFKTMIKSQGLEGFSVLEGEGELVCEYPVNPQLEIDWI